MKAMIIVVLMVLCLAPNVWSQDRCFVYQVEADKEIYQQGDTALFTYYIFNTTGDTYLWCYMFPCQCVAPFLLYDGECSFPTTCDTWCWNSWDYFDCSDPLECQFSISPFGWVLWEVECDLTGFEVGIYTLAAGLVRNNPTAPDDLQPTTVDQLQFKLESGSPVEASSWGTIKALYR